jgi:hypothetical protein
VYSTIIVYYGKLGIASARPHTITQVGAKRPKSAAVQVLPYQSQHKSNKKDKRVRPTTAQPLRRYSSIESQTTAVTAEKVKNKTVPVALTSVPQYFNFWLEKPLLPKTWEVPTHQRKSRRRPRSEYGTRGISGRQGKKDNIGRSRESGDDGGDKDNGILNQVMSGILLETDDHDNMLKMRRRRRSDDSDEDDIMRLIDEDNENSWMKGNDKSLHDDNMSNRLNSLNSTNDNDKLKNVGGSAHDYDQNKSNLNGILDSGGDKNFLQVSGPGNEDNDDEECDNFFLLKQGGGKIAGKKTGWLDRSKETNLSMTRFELPMDLAILESLTPADYLAKYCRLSSRKRSQYYKVFNELRGFQCNTLNGKDLIIEALVKTQFQCVNEEQAENVLKLAGIFEADQKIDFQLFGGICALTERIYGQSHIPLNLQKDLVEVVDFEALDWRLRTCTISNSLKILFDQF